MHKIEVKIEQEICFFPICTYNFQSSDGFLVFIVCHTYFDNFGEKSSSSIAIALVTAIHSSIQLALPLLWTFSWHAVGPFQPLSSHSTKPTKAEFSQESTRVLLALKFTED